MEQDMIRQIYEARISLLELERREAAAKDALARAKYDLRSAKAAQLEYGGLTKLLDKLSGRCADREEDLSRDVRRAEDALAAAVREAEDTARNLAAVRERISRLPDPASLENTPEKCALEAKLCIRAALPLLAENEQALIACRDLLQGRRAGEILTIEERVRIQSAPDQTGEACSPWLTTLEADLKILQIPFELPDYYRFPTAYLIAASDPVRRDKINLALNAAAHLQNRLPGILSRLPD